MAKKFTMDPLLKDQEQKYMLYHVVVKGSPDQIPNSVENNLLSCNEFNALMKTLFVDDEFEKEQNFNVYDLVEKGSLKKIQNLVENNLLDVNAVIETRYCDVVFEFYRIKEMNLLSAAAVCNQYEICEYLLSKGANPNLIQIYNDHPGIPESSPQGFSALFWSCGSNVSSKIVKLLLDHGANQFIENNTFKYAMVLILRHSILQII